MPISLMKLAKMQMKTIAIAAFMTNFQNMTLSEMCLRDWHSYFPVS